MILDGTYQPRIPSVGDIVRMFKPGGDPIFGRWSIVDAETKQPICDFDTFDGYEANSTSDTPTANVEKGGFTQYDKVDHPDEFTVTLVRSGFSWVLEEMLTKLKEYKNSTKLVNIELPFHTYLNCNIKDMSHSIKSGQPVNMLAVELRLIEIQEKESEYITTENKITVAKAKNPSDASTVKKGRLQSILFKGLGKGKT